MSDVTEDMKGSLRCCSCNKPFHAKWSHEHKQFEELCPVCLGISMQTLYELEDDGDEDYYILDDAIEDKEYTEHWQDLNNDDDYPSEGSMPEGW